MPGTLDVSTGGDDFTYHSFPIKPVPAGQVNSVDVEYTMSSNRLSIATSAPTSAQESRLPPSPKGGFDIYRLIVVVVVGVIVLLIIIVWQMGNRRAEANRQVTYQAKSAAGSSSRFCTKCGNQVDKGDKF